MANNIYQKYALGSVLSDSNELDYDTVTESLENGEIPDGVLVWEPFENESPERILELIEEQHDIFQVFVQELDERRGRGEE